MKHLTLLFLISPFILAAQNLVPNWSFEDHTACPTSFNEVSLATGWKDCHENNDNVHHTDYLNKCGGGGPSFSVPHNVWGYQDASTGNAYMGLASSAKDIYHNYRENIYCKLFHPLETGKTYYVSIEVSKSNAAQYATNNLGLKFSVNGIFPINNKCQLHSIAVITDTANWTKVSGSFMADSAYQYIAVGNFFSDDSTIFSLDTLCSTCSTIASLYLIDDVCVKESPEGDCSLLATSVEELKNNLQAVDFYLYEESTTLHTIISSSGHDELTIKLINSIGQSVSSSLLRPSHNNEDFLIQTSSLPSGVYMVMISNRNSTVVKKFFHRD